MKRSRTNPITFGLIGIPVILLIFALAAFPTGATASGLNQMETPMAEATPQPNETPLPGGWSIESGTPSADEIPSSGSMSTGNCPMMGGGAMGSTSGMQGTNMTGMAGMQGGSMMGMTGMQGGPMTGMAGMQGSSMPGMPGMMMPGTQNMPSIASSNPYENPWYLLGWALLALVSLTILGGLVFGFVWMIRRSRSTRQAERLS
jgi:hypothetical protein